MKELFGQPYRQSDPYWIVKGYFDRMYDDGRFIEAAGYIARRWGFSVDGAYCNFPDVIAHLKRAISKEWSFLMSIPLAMQTQLLSVKRSAWNTFG